MKPLPRKFYAPSAEVVAPELLGHFLLRSTPGGAIGGVIVETEAYLADDPACHAYARQTARNAAMWGECGRAYVYLIYGMHFCFNAVCREKGIAEAVLVRAIEPAFGVAEMQKLRAHPPKNLTNGPAKLCAAMDIDRALDGVDLCDSSSTLFIARNPRRESFLEERAPLVQTTRIGISRAADWPLRFYLGGSTHISRR
jgi:DNA-3-methyladenine glycosylase